MASSGGVGAVRRARHRLGGRTRVLGLVTVLGLFASGAGPSVPDSASPLGTHFLSALPLDRLGVGHLQDAAAGGELAAGETPPVTAEAGPGPEEATSTSSATPPTSASAVDRPIVAPPSFPRARNRAPRSARTVYRTGPKDDGVWAVVVGIDDYPGGDADLRAAVADARDVDRALAAYGVPANRRLLLLDRQATAANIRGALAWMADQASANSTIVFFYSGHVRQVAGNVDRDGEAIDEAIVAADGENVYDGQVADLLRGSDARSAWIGIAACYGAGFDDALTPGRILTAAAGEGDVAYENSSLGHSYMVEYMVRRAMLQGKAPRSVQDAFAWARAQIARDYPNRQPVILDRSRGPLVLGRSASGPPATAPDGKASPRPAPRPTEPQPPPSAPPSAPPERQPGGSACAQVLGVSVCSEQRSGRPHHTGPARPVEPSLD